LNISTLRSNHVNFTFVIVVVSSFSHNGQFLPVSLVKIHQATNGELMEPEGPSAGGRGVLSQQFAAPLSYRLAYR